MRVFYVVTFISCIPGKAFNMPLPYKGHSFSDHHTLFAIALKLPNHLKVAIFTCVLFGESRP